MKYDFSDLEDDGDKEDSKYDFTEVEEDRKRKEEEKKTMGERGEKITPENDPRKNFRITTCCANCSFYYYTGVKSRRGYCKLPNIKHKNIGAFHDSNIEETAKRYGWPPTHSTNVCDKHQLRGQKSSIKIVGDYVERNFDYRGKQVYDSVEEAIKEEEKREKEAKKFKTCSKCGEKKPFTEFYKDATVSDGKKSHCIKCDKSYN